MLGQSRRPLSLGVWVVAFPLLLLSTVTASAQSITAGALTGIVITHQGEPLDGAAVTIEDATGGTVRELTTRNDGTFALRMMLPGVYRVLVEVEGYQPVRLRGVVVAAGVTTTVSAELIERPPPIDSVTEVIQSGVQSGSPGRVVFGRELRILEYQVDASDLSRQLSGVISPADGRTGFALGANGLPARMTRVYADGIPEIMMRHPGVPDEPAPVWGIPRDALAQAQVSGSGFDPEWRGAPGATISLITRPGSERLEFAPYLAGSSAKLGGNSTLNPADSNATSVLGGFSLRGPIKQDTATFFLQAGYQSLQTPNPYPWVQGSETSSRDAVQQVAQDVYGTDVTPNVSPAVTAWKGGNGVGRLDWRVSRSTQLMFRAGGSSFKETNPLLGHEAGNQAGASLTGRDLSAAATLTTVTNLSNEFRIGVSLARREWQASALPETRLVGEGIRFGGNAALPGTFETQLISFSDAVQYQGGPHALKAGVSLDHYTYKEQFTYGSTGRVLYGDLDAFSAGTGVLFQANPGFPEARVSAPEVAVFGQDSWQVSPGFDLLLGIRYSTQLLPTNQLVGSVPWKTLTAVSQEAAPRDRRGIQPRLGFFLSPGANRDVTIQGGVGLYSSGIDLHEFAELVHYSGDNVKVIRSAGSLSWPTPKPSAAATRLTLLGLPGQFRAPRAFKGDLGLTKNFPGGLSVVFSGAYTHTDYLLRRVDANLAPFPSGNAQDGRPVWGTLLQQGSLVTSAPGTSRRFSPFELVSVLSPTGYSDYYAAAVALTRPIGRYLSFSADYTFSRTRDNLVGLLEPDAADQLSPFPEGIGGQVWDAGISDLDVPHRLAAGLEFRSNGAHPISLAVRGRFRSGLPFTPGFRPGVDVNGDLGGNNDPVSLEDLPSPSGSDIHASCQRISVGGFAARNSCRASGVGSLDARLGIPIPIATGSSRLVLTVEAFNLIASTTGVVDQAALLIDPAGSLTANPITGAVQIPFVPNPSFGTLLRRGGEPRVLRFGLRMEY